MIKYLTLKMFHVIIVVPKEGGMNMNEQQLNVELMTKYVELYTTIIKQMAECDRSGKPYGSLEFCYYRVHNLIRDLMVGFGYPIESRIADFIADFQSKTIHEGLLKLR